VSIDLRDTTIGTCPAGQTDKAQLVVYCHADETNAVLDSFALVCDRNELESFLRKALDAVVDYNIKEDARTHAEHEGS
jgi:hypothetical protein